MHPEHRSIIEIDGANFSTLEDFYDEVGRAFFHEHPWDRSLDAFSRTLDDMLAEHGPMTIVWKNSEKSREDLSYPETIRQLEGKLTHTPPGLRDEMLFELESAHKGEGNTVFSWIAEIMGEREGVTLIFE